MSRRARDLLIGVALTAVTFAGMAWQAGATARGVGSLFIRSYERGERVHLAMLSRGYTGTLPRLSAPDHADHQESR